MGKVWRRRRTTTTTTYTLLGPLRFATRGQKCENCEVHLSDDVNLCHVGNLPTFAECIPPWNWTRSSSPNLTKQNWSSSIFQVHPRPSDPIKTRAVSISSIFFSKAETSGWTSSNNNAAKGKGKSRRNSASRLRLYTISSY